MRIGPALSGHAAGDRRLGHGHRPAAELAWPACVMQAHAAAAAASGHRARWCRAAARWQPTRRCWPSSAAGGPAFAIDPLPSPPVQDVAAEALAWAAPWLRRAGAGVRHRRARCGEGGAGAAGRGARRRDGRATRSSRIARRPGACAACANWWWPAARPRAPWCRPWASRMRIGPQIDPGVPWTRGSDRRLPRGQDGLHLALKSGNFGTHRLLHQGLHRCWESALKHEAPCAKKSAASARRSTRAAMCTPPPATSACGWTMAAS